MSDLCNDNRFELIEKCKKKLVEGTNIETAPDEMAVLDNILFRFWQMGWLDKLELPSAKECGGDTISRQAAIDAIDDANDSLVEDDYTYGVQSGMEKAKYVIENLPSAQPTYTDAEIQKMQDLESAEIEKAYQLGYEDGKKDAQPEQKIGYWIPMHPLQADDEGAYLCSNCNTGDWDIKPTDKYCKFCGSLMQGVKKE